MHDHDGDGVPSRNEVVEYVDIGAASIWWRHTIEDGRQIVGCTMAPVSSSDMHGRLENQGA